jgi:hypothetical protein
MPKREAVKLPQASSADELRTSIGTHLGEAGVCYNSDYAALLLHAEWDAERIEVDEAKDSH